MAENIDDEKRIRNAVELFKSGYNCSQAVVMAFADKFGLDADSVAGISAGFGGGVGKMRMMCGAVSGMVILAGLMRGKYAPEDHTGKTECYHLVQDLVNAFKKENGSVICAELLGISPREGDFSPAERNAHYYATRPCAAKVESAARIFAELTKGIE